MNVKGIIYDFDGVICDSVQVKTKAFSDLYEAYGKEIQKMVVNYHLKHGGISRYEKIKYYHSVLLGKELEPQELLNLAEKFSLLVKEKVIASQYIAGAYNFIRTYSTIVPQFICTGTPETEILEILEKKDIRSFFKGVHGAPNTKSSIIADILAKSEFQPSQMIYFGDALTDYNAAKEFDMPFIGIRNSETHFPREVQTIQDFNDLALLGFKHGISKK